MSPIGRAVLAVASAAILGSACSVQSAAKLPNPQETLQEADESYGETDYGTAGRLYRSLLGESPAPCPIPYLHLQIGRCLQAGKSFVLALAEYEVVMANPVDLVASDSAFFERYGYPKAEAQFGIAECYEAEGRWEEALSAYQASRDKYPRWHWCGSCKYSRQQRVLDRIARLLRQLDGK